MKIINKNRNFFAGLFFATLIMFAWSCKDEEKTYGPFEDGDLDALITEAQNLLSDTKEGIFPGEYKPGSKKELEDVVEWAIWKKDNSKEQSDIALAVTRLTKYIEKYKTNVVTLATPWVHQESGTYIELADNPAGSGEIGAIKALTDNSFTLEAKFYIVDLNQRGYSNNLFCNAMGEGGANDRGFDIRYFSNGKVDINVGGGDGWKTVSTVNGVLSAGKWMHVAFVNNISSQKLYVDGALVAENPDTYVDSDDDYPFVIGNTVPWDDRTMNAMVTDFRFWTEARTGTQINDNMDAVLTGDEEKLEIFIPFNADLGTEFADVSGKYKAVFKGNIEWMPEGKTPEVLLDSTALINARTSVENEMPVTEGAADGDYPIGTNDYLQSLVDNANKTIAEANRQDQLDDAAEEITAKLAEVLKIVVADAAGVFIDRDDSDAVGLRITPNYTPQGNYTVEFDVNVKSLAGYGAGEFFNNGEFGIWVYGFTEYTEEAILGSGGMRNFTSGASGWETGPTAPALTIIPGNWQHVAIVHDEDVGGHAITIMYVDGVETGRDSIAVPNVSGWGEIWIGNGWNKMNGYMRDFRLWDEARATGDLNKDITGSETNLKIYLPLDKVKGLMFKDETGNFDAELRGIKWNTQE